MLCALCSRFCALCSRFCALYVVRCALCFVIENVVIENVVHCALCSRFCYRERCALCFVLCALCSRFCYRERCAVGFVLRTLCSRFCASYVVHCAVGFVHKYVFSFQIGFKLALYCVLKPYTELFQGLGGKVFLRC